MNTIMSEPWDFLPVAETLDEALTRISTCGTCGHTIRRISETLWIHTRDGRYTCNLPVRYYGGERLPLQFAKP